MENREAWLKEELSKTRHERDCWKRRYLDQKAHTHRVASLLDDEQLLKVIEDDPELVARKKCSFLRKKLKRILETLPDDHPAKNLCRREGE
ncbi:hypothetical protein [Gordonibacter urolithinfaciens]|uniref:hypothetical protein n=1 Tax=Gordonibacter urolithinfaciens TaxID=1335613 RepID=UPI003AADEA62